MWKASSTAFSGRAAASISATTSVSTSIVIARCGMPCNCSNRLDEALGIASHVVGVDQEAGKGVPEIMHPQLRHTGLFPCRIPRAENGHIRLLGLRVRHHTCCGV